MGRTLFCDDTCDECVRHGGAGIARLARPTAPGRRRCGLQRDVSQNLCLQRIYILAVYQTVHWLGLTSRGVKSCRYCSGWR